ncbi:MAG TPA: hypothetical protein VK960_01410 [Acidimicrobiia bacterium]|nr:hypothetical protein [Acidimicrobiia bacterium]
MNRPLVRIVIGLIAANAAIAVFVLLSGDIGDTEGKILLTSLLATATAVLAMTSAPALTAGRLGWIPHLGIATAALGFVMVTVGIWSRPESVWFAKAAGSAYLVAVACALACLLSAWPIRGPSSWVGTTAFVLVAAVAGMLLVAIWFEVDLSGYWRAFSVLAVLLAAAALATPILHRSTAPSSTEPFSQCPFCGAPVQGTTGEAITCSRCGRHYTVRLG